MAGPLALKGYNELLRALAKADRDTRLGIRKTLRGVAEPVRLDAERLTLQNIRRMPHSPQWARMRIGQTRNLVYVAPRQRGIRFKGRGSAAVGRRLQFRRPNLGDLLMREMEAALAQNRSRIPQALDDALETIADDFNHPTGGLLR